MTRKNRIPPNVALWPALSRFYGLSFTELRKMPRWAVRLYVEEMEVLHAHEQMDALEAMSFPYMEDDDRSTVADGYSDAIARGRARAGNGEVERKPLPDALALGAVGIGIVREAPTPSA